MKRVILVFALVLACLLVFTACNPDVEVDDTQPLPATTISISNASDLVGIKDYLGVKYVNYTFSLKKDIDISAYTQWEPIGTTEQPFMATFLGNGKTISNLTYIGMDNDGTPAVASFINNIALFGVTQNAKVTNLTLDDVNLNLYTYGDYFHTAGLVAYNIGNSQFSDINITGNIELSNIYYYHTTYGMDGNVQDDKVITCDTTQYTGGLVAYSSGKTTISDINVDMDINNKNYKAIYQVEESEVDGEIVTDEGYYVHTYSSPLPKQTIAGFLGGYIKNGATISDIEVTGNMEIYSESVYGASAIAMLVGSKATTITADHAKLTLVGREKVGGAGAIAQLDSSHASKLTVNSLTVNAEPMGGSVKNIGVGGIVGYCNDRAVLTDSQVSSFTVKTTVKDKIQIGGIAGTVRDATIKANKATGVFFIDESSRVDRQTYTGCASVVYDVYGNAVVKDNQATVQITLKDGAVSTVSFDKEYGKVEDTLYVNEDGKAVARFATQSNIKDYVEVFVAKEKTNELTAFYHDSEGRELGKVVFSIDDSKYTDDGEAWAKYMSVYYAEKTGLINASGAVLALDGKSFAGYKQITGVPVISGNTVL